jgi:hypothetical protein
MDWKLAGLALVASSAPALAFNDVVISDGTFAPADWTHSILWSMPTATMGPMAQQPTGGNPGFYQSGQHHTVGSFATIYDGHLYTGGPSYDPSTQGAITSIDIQYDYIDLPPSIGGTQNGILISQSGHNYIRPVDSSLWTTWNTHSLAGLLSSDSGWSDVSASGVATGHPDYSSAGGTMQFGYYTFNWSLAQGFDVQRFWGVDNFQVTVHNADPVTSTFCFGDGSLPVACPCGNSGASGHGCNNSAATGGALLTAAGTVQPDTVVLTSSYELPSALSIFLQGNALLPQPVPFGDGLRCIGGTLKRLYTKHAVAGVVSAPAAGDPSITTQSANLGDPIAHGTMREYLVYYRDPSLTFCPSPQGSTFNASQSISITW